MGIDVNHSLRPDQRSAASRSSRPPGTPSPAPPLTVFLVDPHEVVQLGVQALFASVDDVHLVGTAATLDEAFRAVAERWADVVLIDADLDGEGGKAIAGRLATLATPSRYCFLVSGSDPIIAAELSRHGASGLLHKRAGGRHLVDAVRRVRTEGLVMDPVMAEIVMASLLEPRPAAPAGELSERDLDLLRLLGEGRTNREIADALFLSEKTVKNYLSRLFRKLGVRSRTEAALLSARYLTPALEPAAEAQIDRPAAPTSLPARGGSAAA